MDSEENMAKLVLLYVMLSIYVADIVYLWRLQKSLKFAILECKKSKICDFLFTNGDPRLYVVNVWNTDYLLWIRDHKEPRMSLE